MQVIYWDDQLVRYVRVVYSEVEISQHYPYAQNDCFAHFRYSHVVLDQEFWRGQLKLDSKILKH